MSASDHPPHGGLIAPAEVVAACPGARGVVVVGACDAELPLAFRRLLPTARVLALEGLRENYERWLLPADEVESECVVVGARRERRIFYVQGQNGLHSIYDRGHSLEEQRTIRARTLDEVLGHYGGSDPQRPGLPASFEPDIVTIDCEGASWDVVFGGAETMDRATAVQVETEDAELFKGQRLAHEVHALLVGHGFVRRIDRFAEVDVGKMQHDELWVRP